MNSGGEPERDDTGLPPVDIEIPDDARDLDRDVQAYRRELRALRRTERHGRWHRSLGKDGVALPLLACCLILALITGTLLTVFTATSNSGRGGLPGSGATAPAQPGAPVATMVPGQTLPAATIGLDGSAVPVQQLDEAMLILVPSGCDCAPAFRWLAEVASDAGAPAYVVYTTVTQKEASQLYHGLDSQLRTAHGPVLLAQETDPANLLGPASFPAGIPRDQLAAVLVGSGQPATWVGHISPIDNRAPLLRVLKSA